MENERDNKENNIWRDSQKKDFINQIKYLIVFALGFTIAFSWRQTIFDITQGLVKLIIDIKSSTLLSILTSSFITIISVIIIWLVVKYLD
jgi:uncharacterized BrkB/YihY/UPF0761 family membrane protein